MNGMSDVRLVLHSQEISERQGARISASMGPPGLGWWGLMGHRLRTRRVLLTLDADQLRDIGLTYGEARREGVKPFWR